MGGRALLQFSNLPPNLSWQEYNKMFSKYGRVIKLFLARRENYGKVYYDDTRNATSAFKGIHGKPPLNLVLSYPITVEDLYILLEQDKPNKSSREKSTNNVWFEQYVDVFGRVITTVESEDGQVYALVDELKPLGFELFRAEDLNKHSKQSQLDEQHKLNFELYMKSKAAEFMSQTQRDTKKNKVNYIADKQKGEYFDERKSVKYQSKDAQGSTSTLALQSSKSTRNLNQDKSSFESSKRTYAQANIKLANTDIIDKPFSKNDQDDVNQQANTSKNTFNNIHQLNTKISDTIFNGSIRSFPKQKEVDNKVGNNFSKTVLQPCVDGSSKDKVSTQSSQINRYTYAMKSLQLSDSLSKINFAKCKMQQADGLSTIEKAYGEDSLSGNPNSLFGSSSQNGQGNKQSSTATNYQSNDTQKNISKDDFGTLGQNDGKQKSEIDVSENQTKSATKEDLPKTHQKDQVMLYDGKDLYKTNMSKEDQNEWNQPKIAWSNRNNYKRSASEQEEDSKEQKLATPNMPAMDLVQQENSTASNTEVLDSTNSPEVETRRDTISKLTKEIQVAQYDDDLLRAIAEISDFKTLNASEDFEEVYDFNNANDIRCMCQTPVSFEYIEQVMCIKCLTVQHCACLGYLYRKDVPDDYVCQQCALDFPLSFTQEEHKQRTSIYRLIVAYAYFSKQFPGDVLTTLNEAIRTSMIQKLKMVRIFVSDNGEYAVNIELIRNCFLEKLFKFKIAILDFSGSSNTSGSIKSEEKEHNLLKASDKCVNFKL